VGGGKKSSISHEMRKKTREHNDVGTKKKSTTKAARKAKGQDQRVKRRNTPNLIKIVCGRRGKEESNKVDQRERRPGNARVRGAWKQGEKGKLLLSKTTGSMGSSTAAAQLKAA